MMARLWISRDSRISSMLRMPRMIIKRKEEEDLKVPRINPKLFKK